MICDDASDPRKVPPDERRTRQWVTHADKHGAILRKQAGLGLTERLTPETLASIYDVVLLYPEQVQSMTVDDLRLIIGLDAKIWSGMGLSLPEGGALVILNPQQTPERANVTIMEEIAHLYFKHQPSELITLPIGTWKRGYNANVEREAYWTAAAALLPASVVGRAVWKGRTADSLAQKFGVSRELVEFRMKTLCLWCDYQECQTLEKKKAA